MSHPDPAAVVPGYPADRKRQQRAWYWYDWANSGFFTTTMTVLIGPYLIAIAENAACPGLASGQRCTTDLSVLGIPVAPGALPGYIIVVSTIVAALVLPIVGAIADRSPAPKRLLAGFAWVGAAAASAMFFVAGSNWQLGVALVFIANICFAAGQAVYDAILCMIATPDERDRVSSRGWALGYLGGFLLLAINLAVLTLAGAGRLGIDEAMAVRVSLLSAGLWWAGFTLIPVLGLRNREIPVRDAVPGRGLTADLTQLVQTLRHLSGYRQTWMFLLAYVFYNDGIQTVISSASVYGAEELGFSNAQLIQTILVVQFVAFFGAVLFGRLAARFGAYRTILVGLVGWLGIVVAGYFLPVGAFLAFLVLASCIGIVMGGTQALSRSLFSHLIPAGREAEYFSLYQAGERGTSWFGAFLFSFMFQVTDSYRPAIISLVVFFIVGGLLLTRVRVRQGTIEAGNVPPERL